MKTSIFPRLPRGLTQKELRKEVDESGQGWCALILQKYPVRFKLEVGYGATLLS